eukprot:scaffold264858_cov28-Tisochrysis_lutea.AAC.1
MGALLPSSAQRQARQRGAWRRAMSGRGKGKGKPCQPPLHHPGEGPCPTKHLQPSAHSHSGPGKKT